jgi:mono/diheme cytochrome c family protein
MAGRKKGPVDIESRSYTGLWLISALFLFFGALWAVYDDNIARRPWKKIQAGFSRLEIDRIKGAIAAEQQKLDADPAYQEAVKKLDAARTSLAAGENAAKKKALEAELNQALLDDQTVDLNLRFVKSELEELRFFYDDALHHHNEAEAARVLGVINDREALRAERQKLYSDSQAKIEGLQQQIKAVESDVKVGEDALAKLTAARDDLQQKLETVSLGYLPGPKAEPPFFGMDWQPKIPNIKQVVLEEFDRNAYNQPVARVDRCVSCHPAIEKAGFDDQENPWKSHPKRDVLLVKHPSEKFGCTSCHNGDGTAVNSPQQAHANYYDEHGHLHEVHLRESLQLWRGERVQASCIRCHPSVQHLEGAETIARGERLFEELGCHGCHLTEGYEDLAKENGVSVIGPSLRRIAAKVEPGWLVRWVRNPHVYRPRTRMPNFFPEGSAVPPAMADEQSLQIAAYLLAKTKAPSDEWLNGHPPAAGIDTGLAAKGRRIMDDVGCRACHGLEPGEVAGQLGANKDLAPNLSNIAEKTNARWIYHWVMNPRHYSDIARMPSLRLSDDEARAVTAYLTTLGAPAPPPSDLAAKLADPANVAAGEKLVRKYGCAGCHDIPGMENESRIGVELSAFGSKTKEELFFGDRTDLRETWDDWTWHKLKTPRTYETKWIEQLMPQFDLADEDIEALRIFLTSRTDAKYPKLYADKRPGQEAVREGQRLVRRYNCTGCHLIEGAGGDIRRLYAESPSMAPPNLNGEGAKVQSDWLFGFLKNPASMQIRPWLSVRMPTFGLSNPEAGGVIGYFQALDDVQVPYVHVERASLSRENLEAGKLLMTRDYFDCFNCHQRGAQKPEGPPDGWAPDLAMAHSRLNPDWIVEWIRDPQKLMPGTKMPSFYPGGPPDVLGGNDDAQMRALSDYIMSLGLPETPAPSPHQAAGVLDGPPGAGQ